jgi:hypothetical protein
MRKMQNKITYLNKSLITFRFIVSVAHNCN